MSSLLWLTVRSLPQLRPPLLLLPHLAPLSPLARVELLTPPEDIVTPSGLGIEILATSVYCRHRVMAGDLLEVHYTGQLASTGEQFDTSRPGDPISFVIGRGQMIQGLEEGLLGRCRGDRLRLTVPPHLGYGQEGRREAGDGSEGREEYVIPPGSTLIFHLELLKVDGSHDGRTWQQGRPLYIYYTE